MDLLSAFKRKTPSPKAAAAPAAGDADEVQRARTRARQRLIGAAVLVVAGIIGFPLLFETQPRPIPVDLPIEIPRKEAMPPLAMPTPTAPAAPAPAAMPPAPTPAERVITETPADAGREVAASAVAPPASTAPARVAAASAPPAVRPAAPAATSTRASDAARAADAARAQALLDGKPASSATGDDAAAGTPRFVVQIGAFADANSVRDVRAKVEKLGLKTYTHVAQTPDGARARVRVGPFATRAEAERAAAKLKAAALPAAILTL